MANESPIYLHWLAWQPCLVCRRVTGAPPHHPRHDVGMGQRAHDQRAVPLCTQHHEEAQQYHGVFAKMGKEGMREFFDQAAASLWTRYSISGDSGGAA